MSVLEMMIVLLATAILTIKGIKEDVANKRIALLQSEGQNEASINAALSDYLTNHLGSLLPAGFTQTTSTTIAAPTLATLSTQSNTKVTYKPGPFWGGTYQIVLSVEPDNCSMAAGTCHIASIFYPSKPLLKGGVPDVAGAGVIASAGGNQLGFSTTKAPGTITGLNGAWNTPNPLGNLAATVMAINGFGNDANSPYYRRDGSLPLTGAMNANNQNILNAGTVTAQTGTLQGALTAQTANLTANGNALTIGTGGVAYYGDQNGSAAIRANNGLYVQNTAGSAATPIQQVGSVNSSGTVTAVTMNYNTAPATCSWGQTTMRGDNQMWICNKSGGWVLASNLVGNITTEALYQNYSNGWGVNPPACGAGGTAWYKITPVSESTNYSTSNSPIGGARFFMNWNGSQWVLTIDDVLADGANTLIPDQLGLQADIATGCQFAND